MVNACKQAGKRQMKSEFEGMNGAFAAMFTPFDRMGRVNEETIDSLIEHGLKGGLRGFYLTGSTGEGMLLTNEPSFYPFSVGWLFVGCSCPIDSKLRANNI